MTPGIADITFAAGETGAFTESRPHIVLRGLKVPLQEGRSYPFMLEFERAEKMVMVVSVGAD